MAGYAVLLAAAAQAQVPSTAPVPALVPSPAPNLAAPVQAPETGEAQPQFQAATPAPPSTDCGEQAGLYLGPKALKLWVTRQGAMRRDNPLRPLTGDQFVILQVVVNGHLASAYGPDADNMRRAGPPQFLEGESGTKLTWDPRADALPRTIRIVADDGTALLGPIAFQECGEAPKVAAPKAVAKPKPAAKPRRDTAHEGRPGMAIPQGALPQGALPQGAIP